MTVHHSTPLCYFTVENTKFEWSSRFHVEKEIDIEISFRPHSIVSIWCQNHQKPTFSSQYRSLNMVNIETRNVDSDRSLNQTDYTQVHKLTTLNQSKHLNSINLNSWHSIKVNKYTRLIICIINLIKKVSLIKWIECSYFIWLSVIYLVECDSCI